jgi:Sigma-70 region 2
MQPREREFHLELGSGSSHDPKSGGPPRQIVQQSRLAHPGLTAQNQHLAATRQHAGQQSLQRLAFAAPAAQWPLRNAVGPGGSPVGSRPGYLKSVSGHQASPMVEVIARRRIEVSRARANPNGAATKVGQSTPFVSLVVARGGGSADQPARTCSTAPVSYDKPRSRLTRQQERDLVVAAEAGDPVARRELVEAFLPAIAAIARGYHGGIGVERTELLQEGVAGLLFAAQRYDTGLDTPFWAYASFWVRKAMQELVADLTGPVALSDRAVRSLAQIRAARRDHVQAHGAEPTNVELSEATGLTLAQGGELARDGAGIA